MVKPQHRTPDYVAAYKAIKQAQAAGKWLVCHQPICVMSNRGIAPNQAADVAHDDSGSVILGPAHRRCNRRDGAVRGNRMRARRRRRWVL